MAIDETLRPYFEELSSQWSVKKIEDDPTNSDSMTSSDGTQELVNAKIATAEARTDTKLAELIGRLDAQFAAAKGDAQELRASLAAVQSATSGLKTTVIVTAIGIFLSLAALLLAVMSYGDAVFSRGMAVRDLVSAAAKEQQETTQSAINKAVRELQQSKP